MRQKFTVESVLECPNLPGLPTVAMEVISLTREEDVNLREVASRVELDPALTRGSCEPSTVRTSGWGNRWPAFNAELATWASTPWSH